jgi:hypothetical protein
MHDAAGNFKVDGADVPHAAVCAAVPVHAVQGSRLFGL